MPIVNSTPIEKNIYKLILNFPRGFKKTIIVSDTGSYKVIYVKDGVNITAIGQIPEIYVNKENLQNSYIVFDTKQDNINRRERIHFYQIRDIIDVTPNDAYRIAVENGFVGTVEDWLESLRGKSAYEQAVEAGYPGTLDEFMDSLIITTDIAEKVNNIIQHLTWINGM